MKISSFHENKTKIQSEYFVAMEFNINFAVELNIFVEFNKYANSNESSFLKIFITKKD
jgi:hypothetical protein